MRTNSPEAIAITKRFFLAIDYLIATRKMRGLNTFAKKHNINYWNLRTVRDEPEKRVLKVEYIAYIVSDFKVCPEYILFGYGSIMKDNTSECDTKEP